MELVRNILIVDDDEYIEKISIPLYLEIYSKLKEENEIPYKLVFSWEDTIENAIQRLNLKKDVFDVILIDYEFTKDTKRVKGIELVQKIRAAINKRCKIVFYTMRGLKDIDREELVTLINNDVFRYLSKGEENVNFIKGQLGKTSAELIVESLVEAINDIDPISSALEKYLIEYSELLKDVQIELDNKKYYIQEIINSIRMDEELGNIFINNLLNASILNCIDFLE